MTAARDTPNRRAISARLNPGAASIAVRYSSPRGTSGSGGFGSESGICWKDATNCQVRSLVGAWSHFLRPRTSRRAG